MKIILPMGPAYSPKTHKSDHLVAALNFLTAYHREGEGLLDRIITGDEMWVHHYVLESKRASMMWCDSRMKALKKSRQENQLVWLSCFGT